MNVITSMFASPVQFLVSYLSLIFVLWAVCPSWALYCSLLVLSYDVLRAICMLVKGLCTALHILAEGVITFYHVVKNYRVLTVSLFYDYLNELVKNVFLYIVVGLFLKTCIELNYGSTLIIILKSLTIYFQAHIAGFCVLLALDLLYAVSFLYNHVYFTFIT